LLIGAYTPDSGEVLVNDQPLERINRESYLAQIGALFQDYSRYDFATLGENVWFGNVDKPYSRKAIMEALRDAGLSELVDNYKNGLNQILSKDIDSQNATNLSGGQWQRLGIARAFFRSPNILILDEPTSAVDAKSEYEIFRNIIKKQEHKSTIIISHRFSTVRKAEKIIVLDAGKIIEQGTHDVLISQNGVYKEMFELQAEGYT
jgi:ATP-binding cassette subfamily B protein